MFQNIKTKSDFDSLSEGDKELFKKILAGSCVKQKEENNKIIDYYDFSILETFGIDESDLDLPILKEVDIEVKLLSEKEIRSNIQTHLDKEAKKWGYDTIYTAIGYRGDPNIEFNQEAEMFFKWRSAVWTYTNIEMDKVKAGNRDMPTIDDDITSELPKIEDYE